MFPTLKTIVVKRHVPNFIKNSQNIKEGKEAMLDVCAI